MKHLIFAILFYGMHTANAQFMPGTDFYGRNMEMCDSINKLKTITMLRNDSLFGLNIFPHGYPTTIWDSIYIYRFNFNYKVNGTKHTADSALLRGLIPTNTNQLTNGAAFITASAITGKKDVTDSVSNTGYSSIYAKNKSRDSVVALIPIPNIGTPSRSLNSNYTISSTRPVFVSYSDSCVVTNPLLAGNSSADVWLEYSTNGGTSWIQVATNGNKSSVALTVTVAITNSQKGTLAGYIPANALVRMRSVTAGTASVTIVNQQETTL